jgi:hypothetical protein
MLKMPIELVSMGLYVKMGIVVAEPYSRIGPMAVGGTGVKPMSEPTRSDQKGMSSSGSGSSRGSGW